LRFIGYITAAAIVFGLLPFFIGRRNREVPARFAELGDRVVISMALILPVGVLLLATLIYPSAQVAGVLSGHGHGLDVVFSLIIPVVSLGMGYLYFKEIVK
jgi:hypothetical protein